MFTGIVQGIGRISAVHAPSPDFRTHIVELPEAMAHQLQIGASVSNNGCCLTITRTKGFVGLDGCSLTIGEVGANEFNVHLIPETLERTLFGTRKAGDIINIEIDPQTQAVVDTVTRVLSQQASA